ncbi:MAG TPA: hypothetical protein VHX43_03820 [Xanthobacteraceae bacterium]|jgi:hypothetical protein|nr:hypothetical protein [Xanthobacteraceae bacterium]
MAERVFDDNDFVIWNQFIKKNCSPGTVLRGNRRIRIISPPALGQIHREKEAAAGKEIAPVVGRRRSINKSAAAGRPMMGIAEPDIGRRFAPTRWLHATCKGQ